MVTRQAPHFHMELCPSLALAILAISLLPAASSLPPPSRPPAPTSAAWVQPRALPSHCLCSSDPHALPTPSFWILFCGSSEIWSHAIQWSLLVTELHDLKHHNQP